MDFKAPVLRYDEVGKYANKFLETYHPELSIPVPIEHIIEFGLDLHIVPFPEMYRRYKKSGWLSADRTTIFVDEYQQDHFWEKYRFTLAHETGHYYMHEEVYVTPDFQSIEEQIQHFFSIDKYEVDWYDRQGQWFAGHVLVPSQQLEARCKDLVGPYLEQYGDKKLPPDAFKLFAARELAGEFQVNRPVIEIRIDREDLVEKVLFKKGSQYTRSG